MVTEAAVPRSNLKRPRATEQEVDTRKIQIIGEHVQVSFVKCSFFSLLCITVTFSWSSR